MSKNQKVGITAGIIIIAIILIGFVAYQNKQTHEMVKELTNSIIKSEDNKNNNSELTQISPSPMPESDNLAKDPQNATYTIDGNEVTLVNGESKIETDPGSASMITTTLFDAPTTGDLNGDGANDAGVILVVSGNGSGTFYYAAAALNDTSNFTYEGTNAILLGDRISPQTKDIQNEIYTVNFAERAPGEPMTTQPSVGVSKYFKVSGATLTETNQ